MRNILPITILIVILQLANSLVPGGLQPYNLNNSKQLEKIEKLSKYGVETIATRRMEAVRKANGVSSTAEETLKYNHRVLSAHSQVVAGTNYYIKLKMNDANCRQFCAVEECDLVVWERVWENFVNLTSFNCETKKTENIVNTFADPKKRQKSGILVGQVKTVEIDDKSQAALDQIMLGINLKMNSIYLHKVKAVKEIKKQMVAGILYRFTFQIAKTSCDRRQKSIDTCQIQEDARVLECTASVLDKVWMPTRYSNIHFDCNYD